MEGKESVIVVGGLILLTRVESVQVVEVAVGGGGEMNSSGVSWRQGMGV